MHHLPWFTTTLHIPTSLPLVLTTTLHITSSPFITIKSDLPPASYTHLYSSYIRTPSIVTTVSWSGTYVGVPPGGAEPEGRVARLGPGEGAVQARAPAVQSRRYQRVPEPAGHNITITYCNLLHHQLVYRTLSWCTVPSAGVPYPKLVYHTSAGVPYPQLLMYHILHCQKL